MANKPQKNVKAETGINKQPDQLIHPDGQVQSPVMAFGRNIFDPMELGNGYGQMEQPGSTDLVVPVARPLHGAGEGPSLKPTTTSGKMGESQK